MRYFYLFSFLFLLSSCSNPPPSTSDETADRETPAKKKVSQKNPSSSLPLEKIKLPDGFSIDIFAENIDNPRSLCLSPNGTLFVGTRNEGKVYALKDLDGDFKADKVYTLAKGWRMPNGVAFKDGDLYVAEVSKIWKFEDIENNLENPNPKVIDDDYPTKGHHGWKYIAFGPDGKLYVPVGAPCNICESEDRIFNTITRIHPDGRGREIVQEGIRNTVGFTWHPVTKELWFTDNGRDWMGDNLPACELNHAPKDYMHFGYPYCHQGDLPDPKFGDKRSCKEFTPPAQNLGPHVAPLGLEFYTGDQFPEKYKHQIFIAEHGSWNRSTPIGYRVMMVTLENGKSLQKVGWKAPKLGGAPSISNLCQMDLCSFLTIMPMLSTGLSMNSI